MVALYRTPGFFGELTYPSNLDASPGKSTECRLSPGTGSLCLVSSSSPQFDVYCPDAELLSIERTSLMCTSQCIILTWCRACRGEDMHYPTLQRTATSCAASIAAYGEDSSRSAFTFMPPVTLTSVSLPDRSVTCTKVSLKDAKIWATPYTSSPSRVEGPSVTFSSAPVPFFLGAILEIMSCFSSSGSGGSVMLPEKTTELFTHFSR